MFKLLKEWLNKEIIELKNEITRLEMQDKENFSLKVQLGNALNEIERLGGDVENFRESEPVVSLAEYASDWQTSAKHANSAMTALSKAMNFDEIATYLKQEGVAV